MVNIEEHFLTYQSARKFIGKLYTDYPPSIYGTSVRMSRDHYAGTWKVAGSRFELREAA